MLLFLGILIISLARDVAFFPSFCVPLPEYLQTCTNLPLTVSLSPSDFENSPPSCNSFTSPEKCYFYSMSSEISIDDFGTVYYYPESKGVFTYDFLIYDSNINSDFFVSFDYYNMANLITLTITVYDENDIPPVFFHEKSLNCEFCPENCENCIDIQCNKPIIGQFVTENQGRIEFYLQNSTNINVTILKSGYFYTTPQCFNSSQVMHWEMLIYDKKTQCSKIIKVGQFYPNLGPEIIIQNQNYSFYDSSEFKTSFSVIDENHSQNELTVSIDSQNFVLFSENDVYFIYCIEKLSPGNYEVKISVSDTGINGVNVMQTNLSVYLNVKDPSEYRSISFSLVSIVKYSGDWHFTPSYMNEKEYYLEITTFETGITVLDYMKGTLYWNQDLINMYNNGSVLQVKYQVYEVDCNCTLATSPSFLTLLIIDPPIIYPPKPIFSVYNCSITFEIGILFTYPNDLTYSFQGFENFSSPIVIKNTFFWDTPSSGPKKQYLFTVISNYNDSCGNIIKSSMQFYVNLRNNQINFKQVPDSSKVVVSGSPYSLDLNSYLQYDFIKNVTYEIIQSDTNADIIDGNLTVLALDLESFLAFNDSLIANFFITATGLCSEQTELKIDLLVLSVPPNLSQNNYFYCEVWVPCTISLKDLIFPSVELITSHKYLGLLHNMTPDTYSLNWTADSNLASSGTITYSIVIQRIEISTDFIIYVYRNIEIQTFPIEFYQAVIGEYWTFPVNISSYEGASFSCVNIDLSEIDIGPVFSNSLLGWYFPINTYNGSVLSTYTGQLYCEYDFIPMSTSVNYTLALLNRCQISNISNLNAVIGEEWSTQVTVIDPDELEISLNVVLNKPFSMSIDKISQINDTSTFILKWIPNTNGSYSFTLQCSELNLIQNVYPGMIPLTNTLNVTLEISSQNQLSNVQMCDTHVYIDHDWICNITANNLYSCDISAPGLQELSITFHLGVCTVIWNKIGVNLNGINPTLMIRVNISNQYQNTYSLDFSLYPNQIPAFLSPTTYEVPIGRVPFHTNLIAVDAEPLNFYLISGPNNFQVSSQGNVSWISPDFYYVPSYNLIFIQIIDTHPFPYVLNVTLNLTHTFSQRPPSPLCPELVSVEVGFLWTWNTNNDTNKYQYSLVNAVPGMNISDLGIIFFFPGNADAVTGVVVLHTNYLMAQGNCSFNLYPDYRPVIVNVDLNITEGVPWYYRLDVYDLNNYLDDLTISLVNPPEWIQLIDNYGLLYALCPLSNYSVSNNVNLTVMVSDNFIVPLSVSNTFRINLQLINSKPYFVSPISEGQLILSNLTEGNFWSILIEINDIDTPLQELSLIIDYNPYNISLIQDPSNLNIFNLSWTPPNLVYSSGTMTFTVYEKNNPLNCNSIDIIIYNITQIDNPPYFVDKINDWEVTDQELLEIILNVDDIDSFYNEIYVEILAEQDTGLIVLGIDALIRNPNILSESITRNIQINVCNYPHNCNSQNFTLSIIHVNNPPFFLQSESEAFCNFNYSHRGTYQLQAFDPDGDPFIFCVYSGQNITIESEGYVLWENIQNDQAYNLFSIAVTDQSNCANLTSFSVKEFVYCQCFDCCYLPIPPQITFNDGLLCIVSQDSITNVYVGSDICGEFQNQCCKISDFYVLSNFSVSLENTYGISPPFPSKFSIPAENFEISIDPIYFYGTGNEIITITSNVTVSQYWNCWISFQNTIQELVFYANIPANLKGFCILPEILYENLSQCQLIVCITPEIDEFCVISNIYLKDQPYFVGDSQSGHEEGGYVLQFSINFGSWVLNSEFYPQVLFDNSILLPISYTFSSVLLRIPAKKSLSIVKIYISPIDSCLFSPNYTTFIYNSSCLSAGHYCISNIIETCPVGYSCPSTSGTLIYPLPCKAGTYQNKTGQSECTTCEQGFMCALDGTIDPKPCEAGFVCDEPGTSIPYASCPPGHYCEEGTDTQVIDEGLNYYDLRRSGQILSSDHWTQRGVGFGNDSSKYYTSSFTPQCISLSNTPGKQPPLACPAGFYCILAANTSEIFSQTLQSPRLCIEGYLCDPGDGEGFNNTKTCNMGYFCPITPSQNSCNNFSKCTECLCPLGNSCPFQGMTSPNLCATGYFQDQCGQIVCKPCPAGFFCNVTGIDNSTVFMQVCAPGFYCVQGAADKNVCPPGSYNPFYAQSECHVCDRGYYCFTAGLLQPSICNAGYMCTQAGEVIPTICPEGFYCVEGVSLMEDNCPSNETCPQKCPAGHKCPIGSSTPVPCSEGTYQPNTTQPDCVECSPGFYCPSTALTQMVNCTAGYYCASTGLAAPSGQCPSGFYCLEGTIFPSSSLSRRLVLFNCSTSTISNLLVPNEPIPCPPSTYCSLGTASGAINTANGPKACASGYYNDRCGQGSCIACPAGFYCPEPGMSAPFVCPLGTFRSGFSILCESCPTGTWANGKTGLVSVSECSDCPAGYYCDKTGTADLSQMTLCTSGFYCPQGTSKPILVCPAGYFCPSGLTSLQQVLNYPCPPGFYCPEQTVISDSEFEVCANDTINCVAGKKCPLNMFCPLGTSDKSISTCPDGTVSEEGTQNIADCQRNLNIPANVYKTINLLNPASSNGLSYVNLNPMEYAYFEWDTTKYPGGNMPSDYVPYVYVAESDEKIPFIQQDSYKPIYRVPLALDFSDYISSNKSVFTFCVLAHQSVSLMFNIDCLNGLYSDPVYYSLFLDSFSLISINSTSRNTNTQFLSVLSRESSTYFDEPVNTNIHSLLPNNPSGYSVYNGFLVSEISISMLTPLSTSSIFDPQDTLKLWNILQYTQLLYPIDYLPYITDCQGFGAFIPLYQLYTHSSCQIVSKDKTSTVEILNPTKVPNGDFCDFFLSCNIAEKIDSTSKPWFSAYELSKSNIFYITRPQLSNLYYASQIPDSTVSQNSFSSNYYGSGDLIAVQAYRGSSSYSAGMIPRNVKLVFEYYQKTLIDKEILRASIYFSNFDSNTNNRTYSFEFVLKILGWKDCLDLFAFDSYLYYIFVTLVCLFIFVVIVIFWLINYIRSTILPRPSLKIGIYIKYSLRALTGVTKAVIPVFLLMLCFNYGLKSITVLQKITGDYLDNYPIDPTYSGDSTRVVKYLDGRLGTCILILSWYLIVKSTNLLFPPIEKAESPKDIPELNAKNHKLRTLYMWRVLPVLIFCVCTFQFAQSAVFLQYQTLFLVVFKAINGQIIAAQSSKFSDNLYVLPFFGALSLNIILITVKVGAFTAFLTGYLTNVAIKIFLRAFIEPYQIEIANKILALKKRFKVGGSSNISESLGYKDRVYIEQINGLGAKSMELVASVLFPTMIVFNYLFYTELKLTIPKSFLLYFIVFSLIQALAEVGYDVFLNNAIECKTGRLLSEKILELKEIFEERETEWALASAIPHSGRTLIPQIDGLLRFGFSSQYFYTMTIAILGIILQVYAIDFWLLSLYNPFHDSITLFLILFIPLFLHIAETGFFWTLKIVFKRSKKSDSAKITENKGFYQEIRFYIERELESQVSSSKIEILINALSRAMYDKYSSGLNEKRRRADIVKFLQLLENACRLGKVPLEDIINIEELPLPLYKKKTTRLIKPKISSIESKFKKKQGYFPAELIYKW